MPSVNMTDHQHRH